MTRIYRAKNRAIPYGARVKVIRFYPRRRVLVEYHGLQHLTVTPLCRKETK